MSATQIALSDKQLEAELQTQRRELDRLQGVLRGEQRKLDGLNAERNRIVVAIENGSAVKEGELSRAKTDCESAEIRVGGVRKQVAPIEAAIQEIGDEFRRRQEAAAKAAFEKEYAELQEKGAAIASRVLEKLKRLIVEDVAEFDAIRMTLGTRFANLGGQNAAFALRRLLVNPARSMEALRDPEVHLAALGQEGWEARFDVFGDPLVLTIKSMSQTAAEKLRERIERTAR
jgi:seryl-tRNA synthetase